MKNIPKLISKMGIYCIAHSKSGRKYVGSSFDIPQRLRKHRHALRQNNHPNPILQNYFNKYSEEQFSIEVLEIVHTKEELIGREQHWIDQLHSAVEGFNILPKAGSSLGCKWSDEARARRSQQFKGENNPFYGKTHNKETRAILSQKTKDQIELNGNPFQGKKHTSESKNIIAAKAQERTGNKNPFFGKSWSDPNLRDSLSQMKETLSVKFSGERNPFFGKKHDRTKLGDTYEIISPNNTVEIISNLRLWCEANGHKFEKMRSSHRYSRPTPDGWKVRKL